MGESNHSAVPAAHLSCVTAEEFPDFCLMIPFSKEENRSCLQTMEAEGWEEDDQRQEWRSPTVPCTLRPSWGMWPWSPAALEQEAGDPAVAVRQGQCLNPF